MLTTSRTRPACGTWITRGNGWIEPPTVCGPPRVIVTPYVPGSASNEKRPLRPVRTTADRPAPRKRTTTRSSAAGAPGGGPPTGDQFMTIGP